MTYEPGPVQNYLLSSYRISTDIRSRSLQPGRQACYPPDRQREFHPFQAAQAVRNLDDLECLACPVKYRELKSFYKYYTGELTAPYLTLFSAPLPAV